MNNSPSFGSSLSSLLARVAGAFLIPSGPPALFSSGRLAFAPLTDSRIPVWLRDFLPRSFLLPPAYQPPCSSDPQSCSALPQWQGSGPLDLHRSPEPASKSTEERRLSASYKQRRGPCPKRVIWGRLSGPHRCLTAFGYRGLISAPGLSEIQAQQWTGGWLPERLSIYLPLMSLTWVVG